MVKLKRFFVGHLTDTFGECGCEKRRMAGVGPDIHSTAGLCHLICSFGEIV